MERIDATELTECFPGHGEPFSDIHGSIRRNLDTIEERTARVLQTLARLGRATLFDLCCTMYPRAALRRYWQVVATIQGNLDIAESQSAVTFDGGSYEISK